MFEELMGNAVPKIVTTQLRTKLLDFRDECKAESVSEIRVTIRAIDEKVHLSISLFNNVLKDYVREIAIEELLGGLMDFKDKVDKAVRGTFLQISDTETMNCAVTEMLFVITPVPNAIGVHKADFRIALYKIIGTGPDDKKFIREVELKEIMG